MVDGSNLFCAPMDWTSHRPSGRGNVPGPLETFQVLERQRERELQLSQPTKKRATSTPPNPKQPKASDAGRLLDCYFCIPYFLYQYLTNSDY
mmetsp:Transcript_2240/g.5036  ORF Transcript_2240/g.5036 Transcript_2240/m.5036 type:complete len:92 (-) Transcript_2240:1217-1492(-)